MGERIHEKFEVLDELMCITALGFEADEEIQLAEKTGKLWHVIREKSWKSESKRIEMLEKTIGDTEKAKSIIAELREMMSNRRKQEQIVEKTVHDELEVSRLYIEKILDKSRLSSKKEEQKIKRASSDGTQRGL